MIPWRLVHIVPLPDSCGGTPLCKGFAAISSSEMVPVRPLEILQPMSIRQDFGLPNTGEAAYWIIRSLFLPPLNHNSHQNSHLSKRRKPPLGRPM